MRNVRPPAPCSLLVAKIQLDPESIAPAFTVMSPDGTTELVDLLREEAGGLPRGDG